MNAAHEQTGLHLPGYTLVSRLGAGGYGEVWLANAPGGLTKAVKFIFGSFHEKRAEHELRSLQRIKEVRHPFLLSLERIEVVDGRLVIVTELAEASLKDRFDACLRERLPGIPRSELLKYLRDAADALDFLSEKHRLQHLDVKPENLLLIAGHVKVADFGLVKDVGNSQSSLVGGLTPLYSAPEVFQGTPSRHSDQYGLAVLYQEMLTGALPFAGTTAAELTMQHLNEEPDLETLPTADRYVLARALAKDPSQRFGSCGEMIQALLDAECPEAQAWTAPSVAERTGAFGQSTAASPPRRKPGPVTEFFDEQVQSAQRAVTPSMLLDWTPPPATSPTSLPPLELTAASFRPQPTLVVGVGGAAAHVLKQLRARMAKEFGDEPLAAVQLLLLDSDPKSIARALQGNARNALKPEETISLPLRRPQEYREQSAKLMRWLSRRWLYNIPRSLRTEGLRPLGRLAFADHARQVSQRVRMSLARAMAADSLTSSNQQTGLEFQQQALRVFVVASISGGSGSGMSLDVGYAVRAALEKSGVTQAQVIGVFLHSTGQDPRHCDLAKVNAYAWLSEYNHFHQAGGQFPGDESCGLSALPIGRRAFDSAYVVDLGSELDELALDGATQSVAEYLYLDALTPAQEFFDECRRCVGAEANGEAPLRTFALHRITAAGEDAIEQASAALSREVVLRWAGHDEEPPRPAVATPTAPATEPSVKPSLRDTNQVVQGAALLVSQLQLKLESLASNSRALIEAQLGGDQQAYAARLLGPTEPQGRPLTSIDLFRAVDGVFATLNEEDAGAFVLLRPLEAIVSPLSMRLGGDLARWVLGKLDDRQERLKGVQRAAAWLVDYLQRLDADADRMAAGLKRHIAAMAEESRRDARTAATADDCQRALAYFRMRIDHHAVWASSIIIRRLLTEMKSIAATIAEFGRHLKHVAHGLSGAAQSPAADTVLGSCLVANLALLSDAVDQTIQEQFIEQNGGLFQTIMGNSRVRAQLLGELAKLSRRTAEELATQPEVRQAAVASIERTTASPVADANDDPHSPPKLLEFGGVYRALAVAPDSASGARVASSWRGADGNEPSLLTGVGCDVILCYEGWELPLAQIAVDMIQRRRDYADFACRVQSRSDIAWTPLAGAAVHPRETSDSGLYGDDIPAVTCAL